MLSNCSRRVQKALKSFILHQFSELHLLFSLRIRIDVSAASINESELGNKLLEAIVDHK